MYELFFDIVIALVVAGVPLWLVAWRTKPLGPGRLLAVLAWAVIIYGSFVEPRLLVVREYAVDLRSDPAAEARRLDVAVVSDLHLGKYQHEEWLERVVAVTNSTHPDAVLLAGDLATSAAGSRAFAPLAKLVSRYGTYAVLGNWDYRVGAVGVRQAVESHRVEVLTNESVVLGPPGARLRLAGLDDLKYGTPDWDAALADARPGETVAVLAHNPDAAYEAEVRGAPLVIAGHTHGGQIRWPFFGPVPPLPTDLGRRYDRGVLAIGPVQLFITPGVGASGPRARLFQRPEISRLRIIY